ncbi:hypothetical protein AB6A40_011537 [Gnathostoma spinigerum]|uniref:Uncharacterized protein n=1 Tax=Gnathostoma spinigerum TaxID=75299 RepID=A0ABD6EYJ3_9BILA
MSHSEHRPKTLSSFFCTFRTTLYLVVFKPIVLSLRISSFPNIDTAGQRGSSVSSNTSCDNDANCVCQ